MRKWFASLGVLGFASAAMAQTMPVPPVGGCGESQMIFFDDGSAETSWKVSYPTGAGDAFNLDFDDLAGGMTARGVALNTFLSTNTGPLGIRYIALCSDNIGLDSTGHTPDLSSPLSILGSLTGSTIVTGSPGISAGYCSGFVGYDLPDVTIPSTGGLHTVTTCVTGDTGTWLCSDLTNANASNGRSYFTINNYSTPALALSAKLQMRLIADVNVTEPTGSAYFTVNNFPVAVSFSQTDNVTTTLWSNCATQPTLYFQGAFITGYPFIPAPALVLSTGFENFSTISDSQQGTVCGPASDPSSGPCVPAGLVFKFGAFYLDNCDLTKKGKSKVKLTNLVTCTITPSPKKCNPCVCWGQFDDGQVENFWKDQNPAGPADYFNVRFGSFIDPNSGLPCQSKVSDFQIPTYDTCTIFSAGNPNPKWGSIGLYTANTGVDSTGNTPDLSNPVVSATSLSYTPGVLDFSYPCSTYDFPDVNTSTSSALAGLTNGHVVAGWNPGDTCTWMGGDTDGTDDAGTSTDACSTIPSTSTFFTITGYSTAAIQATYANWMMKVDF